MRRDPVSFRQCQKGDQATPISAAALVGSFFQAHLKPWIIQDYVIQSKIHLKTIYTPKLAW